MRSIVACLCLAVACFGCALGVTEEEYKDCEAVCFAWQSAAIECELDHLVSCDLGDCTHYILSNHDPVWCRSVDMAVDSCAEIDAYSATPLFPLMCPM